MNIVWLVQSLIKKHQLKAKNFNKKVLKLHSGVRTFPPPEYYEKLLVTFYIGTLLPQPNQQPKTT